VNSPGQPSAAVGARLRGRLRVRREVSSGGLNLRRDMVFRRSLAAADLIAFLAAFATLDLLFSRRLAFTPLTVVGLAVLLVVAKVIGLYDRDQTLLHKTTLDETPKLFQIATLGVLCTWLAGGHVIVGGPIDRVQALALWACLLVYLVLARAGARRGALRIVPPERCFFIGDTRSATAIESKLAEHRGFKAQLVGSIDPVEVPTWSTDALSDPRLPEIRELARSLDVQRAIVAPDSMEPDAMLNLICTLEAVDVKVSVLPRLLQVVGSSVEFDDLDGMSVMGVRRFALTRSSTMVKRGFDLCVALLGLLAVAPLMAVIALAIKIEARGKGSVFFKQCRVGRHGRHIGVYKFRTMVPEAEQMKDSLRHRNEADGLFKIADDPRITRVGKLLRGSALDELPQLFNIVRGEMSLVGPRPLVVDEDQHVTGWYRRRLELMPGMTGPWQILGPSRVPLKEMVAIDYLYVANWSLWGDVKILLRTVPHVLGRRGV
jgi:exopolysaccharide biosynthesis polyprenyl glycosylphosphotransferase